GSILGRWWRYKWITFHPSLTVWLPRYHTFNINQQCGQRHH
ncbi:hypothetical protein YPPY101_0115, partial [Yersinia pestis PY-101]